LINFIFLPNNNMYFNCRKNMMANQANVKFVNMFALSIIDNFSPINIGF
jgi:hypothetical protein